MYMAERESDSTAFSLGEGAPRVRPKRARSVSTTAGTPSKILLAPITLPAKPSEASTDPTAVLAV
jgi:hypothetical protein